MKAMKFSATQIAVLEDNREALDASADRVAAARMAQEDASRRLHSNIAKYLHEQAGTPKAVGELEAAIKENRVNVNIREGFTITVTEKDDGGG